MNKFASLCILSYNRPQKLIECLDSLYQTIDYPCEIIVNCDGEDTAYDIAYKQWQLGKVSKIVLNKGKNRGVGRSFQNCLGIAEGDYIFKIDADLTFEPKWISSTIKILQGNPDVGAVGLFDYNKWDPLDSRFTPENNFIEKREDYFIVKDFVSSIYAFRLKDFHRHLYELPVPDDGLHQTFGKMALNHKVNNTAWGVGRSTYVSGTNEEPFKTPTFNKPLIFRPDLPSNL